MSSVVFVDSRVQDYERLLAGLAADVQVVILDPARDGVAQIADALDGVSDLDSIHIVSHGSTGTLYLGSTVLTESIFDDYEAQLAQIGASLSEKGDLLLYGCEAGAGEVGQSFITRLAAYTGADIAASTDLTGNSALGGDWELEANTGTIDSAALFDSQTSFGALLAAPVITAAGLTDTTFDSDGKVVTPIGASNESGRGVALQSDGKIVVAGNSWNGANFDFALARYNTDGSPDTSFSGDGKLTTAIGSGADSISDVALQSDGKIVVAGQSSNGANNDFALARYNADGSPDTSFSGDGKLTTPIGTDHDNGESVAIQIDGKIVVAGASWNGATYDFALARYAVNGQLDSTFGNGGLITTSIGASLDYGLSVAIQADGKIIVAGYSLGADIEFALARYNTSGTLDTSFGSNGTLTTPIGTYAYGESVAIQTDGKIIVAGYGSNGVTQDALIVRYNSNGTLDSTFAGDGIDPIPVGSEGSAHALALQRDGMIVAAGSSWNGANYDFALVRVIGGYLPDQKAQQGVPFDLAVPANLFTDPEGGALTYTATKEDGSPLPAWLAFNSSTRTFSGTPTQSDTGVLALKVTATDGESLAASDSFVVTIIQTVSGDSGDNFFLGGDGDDSLWGGAGNDTLEGGAGNDTLDGGADVDLASYSGAPSAVTVNLALGGIQSTGGAGIDTFVSIEGVIGSDHDDTLTGDGAANFLSGLAGNDTISGGAGNDTLAGGAGYDSLVGGADTDLVSYASDGGGGVSVDLEFGNGTDGWGYFDWLTGIENVEGSDGSDSLRGDNQANVIDGRGGHDSVIGGAGNDTLIGGGGNDTLSGGIDTDRMVGGDGDDRYEIETNFGIDLDQVVELLGEGYDEVFTFVNFTLPANVEAAYMQGSDPIGVGGNNDDNYIVGNSAANTLSGNGGGDWLEGAAGNDTMTGGLGFDTAEYENDPAGVIVSLFAGSATDGYGHADSLAVDIEGVSGSRYDDHISGDGLDNYLRGNNGLDTVSYSYTASAVVVDLALGFASGSGDDILQSFENAEGSGGADVLSGSVVANVLHGLGGADSIEGAQGNDTLDGGDGVDTMVGGDGDDVYYVDHADDRVVETSNAPLGLLHLIAQGFQVVGDTVYASVDFALEFVANVENLVLTHNVLLTSRVGTGNNLSNALINESFAGGTLNGLGGNDTLDGGAGNDTLNGGDGTDTAVFAGALAEYQVISVASGWQVQDMIGGRDGNDLVQGVGLFKFSDQVLQLAVPGENWAGTADGDLKTGGEGNDTLDGAGGDDTLNGGDGNDSLVGGAGHDRFDWTGATRGGIDTMRGGAGDDQFNLSAGDVVVELDGEGTDTVWVDFAGTYVLGANLDNLTLWGAAAGVHGTGNGTNNVVVGNSAANVLNGADGNDTLNGGAGNDTLNGGVGNDLFDWTSSLRGGIDTMRGGAGDDQFNLSAGDVVVELSGEGTDTVWVDFSGTYVLGANVENLTLWGSAAGVNGRGNATNNVIIGNSAANTLDGGDGNDSLVGGAGNDLFDWTSSLRGGTDTMRGGTGDDQYVLTSGDYVVENVSEGTDTVWVDFAGTYVLGPTVENLTLWGNSAGVNGTGNSGVNVILGNSQANTLNGGDGNDTLNGGAGNDLFDWTNSLRGGNDWMYGRQGDDQFNINAGDVVQEFFTEGTDTVWVDFAGTYILGPTLENLTLWGSATGVNGTGNANNNVMQGNSAANTLNGSGGNDSLVGGAGNDLFDWTSSLRTGTDTMRGGPGDDQFNLSSGDLVIENAGEGTDTAWVDFTGYVLPLYVENLTLWGTAAISGTGNGQNNVLTGNGAVNSLDGAGGNDTISGGTGADTLIGGTGDDTLIHDGADTSVQGNAGTDTYRIATSGITLNLAGLAGVSRTGIETIDLTGTGNNTLTVAVSDVLAISDTTNTLRVDGNTGDVVNAGTGWADGGTASGYHTYTQGAATLIVDEDITRNVLA